MRPIIWPWGQTRPKVWPQCPNAVSASSKSRSEINVCLLTPLHVLWDTLWFTFNVFVCLFVFLSARVFSKTTRPNFNKFSVTVAVTRSSSESNAIGYALPVSWMTSCFHVMQPILQSQRRRVCFVQFARWQHRGRSMPSLTAPCYIWGINRDFQRFLFRFERTEQQWIK